MASPLPLPHCALPLLPSMSQASTEVVIRNKLGMHARPAMAFVDTACSFESDIQVKKAGQSVDGKSIMQLMMLAATEGTKLQVVADGSDAQQAVDALHDLVERRFDEEIVTELRSTAAIGDALQIDADQKKMTRHCSWTACTARPRTKTPARPHLRSYCTGYVLLKERFVRVHAATPRLRQRQRRRCLPPAARPTRSSTPARPAGPRCSPGSG